MRIFVAVQSVFVFCVVLLVACVCAHDGATEVLQEAGALLGDVQWPSVKAGSRSDFDNSAVRQDTWTGFETFEGNRKLRGRKIFPSSLFKSSLFRQCRLPSRFEKMTVRVPCICCERMCNCADLSRAVSRSDDRYTQSDAKNCAVDEKRCTRLGKWSHPPCPSCDSPWFFKRDPFRGFNSDTKPYRFEEDSGTTEQHYGGQGYCMCNMPLWYFSMLCILSVSFCFFLLWVNPLHLYVFLLHAMPGAKANGQRTSKINPFVLLMFHDILQDHVSQLPVFCLANHSL